MNSMILGNNYPKLLTHKDIFKNSTFFGSDNFIITSDFKLFLNKCPHRGSKIIPSGTTKSNLECNLHGWCWNKDGSPINNHIPLLSKNINVGKSGIIFLDWVEPQDSKWVKDLEEDQLEYSHSIKKIGSGDWKWQMEMHVDLLHVNKIHPLLDGYVNVKNLTSERGDDWIAQYHEYGWWLFVYPFTHIEYEPGCLYFSEMSPRQNREGYDIYIHYMFNKHISNDIKDKFIKMSEITLDEDIEAVNNISMNSRYRKPGNLLDPLETDIIHFYNWLEKNTK